MDELRAAIKALPSEKPVEERKAPQRVRIGFTDTCRNLLDLKPGERCAYRRLEHLLKHGFVDVKAMLPGEFSAACDELVDWDL